MSNLTWCNREVKKIFLPCFDDLGILAADLVGANDFEH